MIDNNLLVRRFSDRQVKTLFDELWERRAEVAGKPAMGFVSHGRGGKARESLAEMAKHFK